MDGTHLVLVKNKLGKNIFSKTQSHLSAAHRETIMLSMTDQHTLLTSWLTSHLKAPNQQLLLSKNYVFLFQCYLLKNIPTPQCEDALVVPAPIRFVDILMRI